MTLQTLVLGLRHVPSLADILEVRCARRLSATSVSVPVQVSERFRVLSSTWALNTDTRFRYLLQQLCGIWRHSKLRTRGASASRVHSSRVAASLASVVRAQVARRCDRCSS